MLYPIVKRSLFEECGITLEANAYYPECSTDQHLIEKIIMTHAEWLSKDKTGALVGFNPETHVQIGSRLVLSENGQANSDDWFWLNLHGDQRSTMYELKAEGLVDVVNLSGNTHAYTIHQRVQRGWATEVDSDEQVVALCVNNVFAVSDVMRK